MRSKEWKPAHNYQSRPIKSKLELPGPENQVMLHHASILKYLKLSGFNSLSIQTSADLLFKDPAANRSTSYVQSVSEHELEVSLMPRLVINFNPVAMHQYQLHSSPKEKFGYGQQVDHILRNTLVNKGLKQNLDIVGSAADLTLASAELAWFKKLYDQSSISETHPNLGILAVIMPVILTHFLFSNGFRGVPFLSEAKSEDPSMSFFIGSKLGNMAKLCFLGLTTHVAAPADAVS